MKKVEATLSAEESSLAPEVASLDNRMIQCRQGIARALQNPNV